MQGQDWNPIILTKKRPTTKDATSSKAVNAALRSGAAVETVKKFTAGTNKSGAGPPKDAAKLDRETEELSHERIDSVPSELKKRIMQARLAKGMTQAALAQAINEKPQVVQEYESGRAIPSPAILSKLSRILGVPLSAKKK